MGIYSTNQNLKSFTNDIEIAHGYDNEYAGQIIMIENCQNQFALFEGSIRNDIQEATMRINGVDEDEILAFSENALTSLLGKIKEMFKKLWAKIKTVFQSFVARMEATFGKNNKQFVEKYKNIVLGKDLSDFEPKYRKPKANPSEFDSTGISDTNLNTMTFYAKGQFDAAKKKIEDWDEETEADACLKACGFSDVSWKEFDKEFMDHFFDDEAEEKVSIHTVMSELVGFQTANKNLKKTYDSLNKAMDKMIRQIDKDEDELNKNFPKGKSDIYAKKYSLGKNQAGDQYEFSSSDEVKKGNKKEKISGEGDENSSKAGDTEANSTNAQKYQKALQLVSKYAHLYQNICSKVAAGRIKVANFRNKQNRVIWAKAVAYSRKKNEEVMMEAFAELAEWEADY